MKSLASLGFKGTGSSSKYSGNIQYPECKKVILYPNSVYVEKTPSRELRVSGDS